MIFQDGKIIWLRHGSYACKVSINRLQPVPIDLSNKYREEEQAETTKVNNTEPIQRTHREVQKDNRKVSLIVHKTPRHRSVNENVNNIDSDKNRSIPKDRSIPAMK